jgi:serine kinase of HPr protein (carbohydrate metabolism regulator)
MGLKVPLIRMPVATGRNLAILVEVAARNQLLRMRGINAARELVARLDASLEPSTPAELPHGPEGGDDDDDLEPGSLA